MELPYKLFPVGLVLLSLLTACGKNTTDTASASLANSSSSTTTTSVSSSSPMSSSSAVSVSSSQSSSVATGGSTAVQSLWPTSEATQIALVTKIEATFSQPLISNSFNATLISLRTESGAAVSGQLSTSDNQHFVFAPDDLLAPDTLFTVTVQSAMGADGSDSQQTEWTFQTVADVYDTPQDTIDICMNERDIAILAAVNTARQTARNCGSEYSPAVNKLRWHCTLQNAAITHAQDMATNDFFSHTGSDGSSPSDRVTAVGYRWMATGENIAAGQRSVEEVMTGWLDSPGHCVNIMSSWFTEFGFGYVENSNTQYRRYWAQTFAAPR